MPSKMGDSLVLGIMLGMVTFWVGFVGVIILAIALPIWVLQMIAGYF